MQTTRTALIITTLILIASANCAIAQNQPEVLAAIRIERPTNSTEPAIAEFPDDIAPHAPLSVIDANGDIVPSQVEPAIGNLPARIWIAHTGPPIKQHSTHHYKLVLHPNAHTQRASENRNGLMRIAVTGEHLTINRFNDTQPIIRYNHGYTQLPEGVGTEFLRSGYIHPVYSPNGRIVTDTRPEDHLHHVGVWFPWVNTDYEGRHIDFWNLGARTGTVRFAEFGGVTTGPVYAGFRTKHHHLDLTQNPDKLVIREIWDVTAIDAGNDERIWNLESIQTNVSDSPLKLNQYRYGGLGVRFARSWVPNENYHVLTSEGHTFADAHTTRARWVAHSGNIDGEPATVVVMCHPTNERYPETIRSSADFGPFFNWAPVQLGDWTLSPGQTWTFRYRFYIYDGPIDAARAEAAFQQFANPPRATIEPTQ